MKLNELVQPKPTAKELHDREVYSDPGFQGPLDDGQVYVAKNQKDAFIAYIMARLREMDVNPKHVDVGWASARQATAFPYAKIRFIVKNKKSKLYTDEGKTLAFPVVAKALTKNAFKEILGINAKVDREHVVDEYMNGWRFLDFHVERA